MLKIGQNWGKIANYPPNAQQRLAPLNPLTKFETVLRSLRNNFATLKLLTQSIKPFDEILMTAGISMHGILPDKNAMAKQLEEKSKVLMFLCYKVS